MNINDITITSLGNDDGLILRTRHLFTLDELPERHYR